MAIENCDLANKINYQYADAYFIRGNSYSCLAKPQKAIENYRKAAALYQQQNLPDEYQKVSNLINKLNNT